MKKTYIFLSLLLALCTASYAKEVPLSTAKTVGYNYLLQHGMTSLNDVNDLNLVYTSGTSPAYFYVFSGSNCFVIVSAEDAVVPVLGYSKEGAFRADHIPASISSFLEGYNKQIDYVITNKVAAGPDIETSWSNLIQNKKMTGTAERTTTVLPLITTTWDQIQYYNDDCPIDAGAPAGFGGRVPTGCVATCVAQVMKFWSWPAQGVGSNSYATSSYGTLSANFGTTTYNWASMPSSISAPNTAIATLMFDLGVALNMQYSPNESGSYVTIAGSPITNCAEYALGTYFNYTVQGVERSSYADAAWLSLIEGELTAGRPVVYDGDGTAGGHCFVADGFDASDNFHINWGWSGADNGYYYMDALNPPSLGTGGGAGGFNANQEALINLKPNAAIAPSNLELYDYVNVTQSSISYDDTFTVYTNVLNNGTTTFNGDFCFAAFDATTGNFITYLDSIMATSLPAGDVFTSPGFGYTGLSSVAMIPGTYDIKVLSRPTGGSWSNVATGGGGLYINSTPITVYNHNPIEIYSPMTLTPTTLVQGSSASVSLDVYNGDVSPWADSLYLGLYNMDGTPNSDINYIAGTSLGVGSVSGTLNFNTSSITATPGTYLLVLWFKYSGAWYLCGADYDQNPVTVNVVAPAPVPDMYEVNNTAATAYDLTSTLVWSSNTAHAGTPGSTIHITSDQDYYKVTLPAGYNYSISARTNDIGGTDDGLTYTADVLWSYSVNGGSSWSAIYNNTMTGNIVMTGGGTIIFHVAPAVAGSTGSYLLKLGSITRSIPGTYVPDLSLAAANIFPNPASNIITIDLSGTDVKGSGVTFTDVLGKKVLSADITNKQVATISLSDLAAGVYLMSVTTDAGMINKKITVRR